MAPHNTRNRHQQKGRTATPRKTSAQGVPGTATRHNDLHPVFNACISLSDQQQLLNVFQEGFADLLAPNQLQDCLEPRIQQIKKYLFERNFDAAFGDVDLLRAYAARWSPSRALGYRNLLQGVYEHHQKETLQHNPKSSLEVVSIGAGGGAELVALAGLTKSMCKDSAPQTDLKVNIIAVDIADWTTAYSQLHRALQRSLFEGSMEPIPLQLQPLRADVLELDESQRAGFHSAIKRADVVTIFFTLNELFTRSLTKTQTFLFELSRLIKRDCLLLVVDSAGSYSTVGFSGTSQLSQNQDTAASSGSEKESLSMRKYPMAWLLDHCLLEMAPQLDPTRQPPWNKLHTCESRWFRLPDGLRYPIDLENMRHQAHIFQHG